MTKANDVFVGGFRVSRKLYEWLTKQSTTVQATTGVRLPITSVVRGALEKLMEADEKKKARK